MRFLWHMFLATFLMAGAITLCADVWTDLGTEESEARSQTVQTVLNGNVPYLGVQAFKKAPAAVRVAIVQRVAAWAKAFTQSPGFKTAYDAARANEKPAPPENTGSYAAQLKKQREDFEKNAVQMRKDAAGQSKEIRDMIESTIKQTFAQLDAVAGNAEQMKMMEDATAQGNAGQQAKYKESLARFDKEHPATPQSALAARLHRFLDVCGTVDFAAALVPDGNGKMKFANPEYERKPSEWKMCFRAGREPVDAAKALALAWLKELGG